MNISGVSCNQTLIATDICVHIFVQLSTYLKLNAPSDKDFLDDLGQLKKIVPDVITKV